MSPTYVVNIESLKASLRLSGIPSDSNAEQMLFDAVKAARLFFIRRLGASLTTVISAYTRSDTPSTVPEVMRATAEGVEVAFVRRRLLDLLPTQFVDGSSSVSQAWNSEGLARNLSLSDVEKLKDVLDAEIEEGIAYLLDGGEADNSSLRAETIGPDGTPDTPGIDIVGVTY